MSKNAQTPRRILLIQLRQIGDVLMCSPAIRAIRESFPDARIDFLAETVPAKALEGNPHLTELIIRNPKLGARESVRIFNLIRSKKYDVVIDFLANPRSALITFLSGAPIKISYADNRRKIFYNRLADKEGKYSAAHKLSLLKPLGLNGGNLRPEYFLSDRAKSFVEKWIAEVGLNPNGFIVIDPTHRRPTRRWSRFGELADVIARNTCAKCVFLWGPGEENYVDEILSRCSERHVKAPATSLEEMAAIISNAATLIGTDSSPRHFAAALGVPTLVVVGSTSAENWTLPEPIHRTVSLDIECRPCDKNECKIGNIECLEKLPVEKVFEALQNLAKEAPGLGALIGGAK